jgi:hypothetical protein
VRAGRHHHPTDRAAGSDRFQHGVAAVQQIAGRPGATRCWSLVVALIAPRAERRATPGGAPIAVIAVAARRRATVALVSVTPGSASVVVATTTSSSTWSARAWTTRPRAARRESTRSRSARPRAAPTESASPADPGAARHEPAGTHPTILSRPECATPLSRWPGVVIWRVSVAEVGPATSRTWTGTLASRVVPRAARRTAPVEGARAAAHDPLLDVDVDADLFAGVRDHPIVVTLPTLPWRLFARLWRRLSAAFPL